MFVYLRLVAQAVLIRQAFCLIATSLDSSGRIRRYEPSSAEVWRGHATQNVALHFSLQGNTDSTDDKGWQHRLSSLLDALHYCFDELLITIDPPHGGKTYGPAYLPAPFANGTSDFLMSPHGKELLQNAQRVFTAAASQLKSHCPKQQVSDVGGVSGGVHVIDYALPRSRKLLAQAFDLSAKTTVSNDSPWKLPPRSSASKDFLPARMWKNSFMYMYAVDAVKSPFLVHADADLDILSTRLGKGLRPSFPEGASQILAHYPKVVSVGAPSCYRDRGVLDQKIASSMDQQPQGSVAEAALQGWDCASGGCKVVDGSYIVAELTTSDAEVPLVPYISTKLFLTDVSRLKSLWPLPYWEDQTEIVLMHALGQHQKQHAYLTSKLSDLCFD
mmetsp:Transcript_115646/g.181952  ORF Transcript_115646/g.181952 Transcript_115646/m.181952 type:complete len:387 (-) Transcript_115646:14-1174(-)